jgi:exopolyphosphatase
VANLPSKDVGLRPEFTALLRHADLEPTHLITLDDLPSVIEGFENQALDRENTNWILVDHNALEGSLGRFYSNQVSGVIDHHAVEDKDRLNSLARNEESQPRIIETSGSCTSLVTNYLRPTWDELSKQSRDVPEPDSSDEQQCSGGPLWDAQVAQLALASILIDTTNLRAKDKVTDNDTKAVSYLEAKIEACPEVASKFDRDQFYEEISNAGRDIGQLSVWDILRKDYKQWQEGELSVGISSVAKPLSFIIDKAKHEGSGGERDDHLLDIIGAYAKDQKLDIYMVMTAFLDSDCTFRRQLFAWGLFPAGADSVKIFEQMSTQELGLKAIPSPLSGSGDDGEERMGWRKVWQQGNTQHSRKRVAPLIREAMKDVGG